MKIVHVIQTLDPAKGGPPRVAAALAAAQTADGHEVALVSMDEPSRGAEVRALLSGVPGGERVRRVGLPTPGGRLDRITARQAVPPLTSLLADAEALHIHGVWEPVLLRAAQLARRRGVPYAVRPAGMLDPWSMRQKQIKKKIGLWLGYRGMLDGCAFLHVLNRDEAELVKPLGLRCPVRIVPNGVFPTEYETSPPAGGFYAEYPQLQGRPFVLFMSRLHHKKGLDVLAALFARVARVDPDVVLVVAGPEEGAGDAFRKSVAEAGLSDRVFVIGPIYGKTKRAALIDAACFCLPSRQEGFSVAITEALASACPVVITEGCHFPEVAEVGAGFVTPLDAAELSRAVLEVLADTAAARQAGAAGRTLVFERFVWPRIAGQLVSHFAEAR